MTNWENGCLNTNWNWILVSEFHMFLFWGLHHANFIVSYPIAGDVYFSMRTRWFCRSVVRESREAGALSNLQMIVQQSLYSCDIMHSLIDAILPYKLLNMRCFVIILLVQFNLTEALHVLQWFRSSVFLSYSLPSLARRAWRSPRLYAKCCDVPTGWLMGVWNLRLAYV